MHRANEIRRIREPGADYEIQIVGESADAVARLLSRAAGAPVVGDGGGDQRDLPARERHVRCGLPAVGGVAHAAPGSFRDAFFFSVQTMGTIGYGAMFPDSTAANVVVVAESMVGLTADRAGDRPGVREVLALDGAVRVLSARGDLAAQRRPDAGVPARQPARQPDRGREDPARHDPHRAARRRGNVLPDARPRPTRARALSLSRSWNVAPPARRVEPAAGETPLRRPPRRSSSRSW